MAAIYLIRHAQASWGKRDYDRLSETGMRQARLLGETLAGRGVAPRRVVCGGMRRHRQTAEHCLQAMGLAADWQEDERWNEYDHREIIVRYRPLYRSRALMMADLGRSLRPYEAFQEMFEAALGRWVAGQHQDYGESWAAFKQRCGAALQALTAAAGGDTLVFSSGGPIAVVVARLWGVPDSAWLRLSNVMANAAVSKILIGRRGIHLSTFNEHSHFEGGNRALLTYR